MNTSLADALGSKEAKYTGLAVVVLIFRRPLLALLLFLIRLALVLVRPTLLVLGVSKACQLIAQRYTGPIPNRGIIP